MHPETRIVLADARQTATISVRLAEILAAPTPHVALLGDGRFSSWLTAAGSGGSAWRRLALTRWRGDRLRDADGYFFYLRDLDSGVVWSAGYQPVQREASSYVANFTPGRATITRTDEEVETRLEVAVAPEVDVELRRLTLRNFSDRPRRLEVTSYAEVVLNDPAADDAHPAFSKLFVQTERLAGRAVLLAHRRKRGPDDPSACLLHLLAAGDNASAAAETEAETDRMHFIGRGRSLRAPRALDPGATLSGSTGSVLDPIVSLRRTVELAPGAEASLCFGLGAAESRQDALALADRFGAVAACEAALESSATAALEELERSGVSPERALTYAAYAGALLYGDPRLRAPAEVLRRARGPRSEVWKYGVSGDLPLVVADVADADAARELLRAQRHWRFHGVATDLLLLSDAEGDRHPQLEAAVAAACEELDEDARGASELRPADEVPEEDRVLLESVARSVARGGLPEWSAAVPSSAASSSEGRPSPPSAFRPADRSGDATPGTLGEGLRCFNGYGGFSPDGTEYVIPFPSGGARLRWPPLPWSNVVANERCGFLVTESGAGCTWRGNSRENRLTPWSNDPVIDPHGEALYLRDQDAGVFWSPAPGPVPGDDGYQVRHGWGYTRFLHEHAGLREEAVHFVPPADPVRICRVRVENTEPKPRRLSLFVYWRLVLGALPEDSERFVVTEPGGDGVILARNRLRRDFADAVTFAAALPPSGAAVHLTADRAGFLGRLGSAADPAALRSSAPLDGVTGAGLDPCAAFQVELEIAPGETVECTFLLGEGEDEAEARKVLARYRDPAAVAAALEEVRDFWVQTLGAVQVRTPSPAIDLLVNGWLLYQDLACRVWGRTAFYQSGGAFGFRDQLQDVAALVYTLPDLTRSQILLHAAHQFVEGDVLHWWHPPADRGIRTRFSDDLLWLPYVTAFYLETTGDRDILDQVAPFLTARELKEGEAEAYLDPEDSGETAPLYEHCCRALDRSLTRGAHGLPLIGSGDWNDGMNRVGIGGRGESVWLGFFLYDILEDWIPLCASRGDAARAERYAAYRAELRDALNDGGWDGGWYRRAYYDDGTPLGSAESDEDKIDALAQAWAVISGAAPPDRVELALDAMEEKLVSEEEGLIRLLTPAFDETEHDPGYIKGYIPGVRENGGQYTHAALWAVRALAEAGRGGRAAELLEMLSPVHHARSEPAAERYATEPYVVAADVYGVAPHVGRGGWTWYTGSAGWMFRVALESVLGLTLRDGEALILDPRVPPGWPGFEIRYRLPEEETVYAFEVSNPDGVGRGVRSATLDGAETPVGEGVVRIPLAHDGAPHRVRVVLGELRD